MMPPYTPTYFDFATIKHQYENAETLMLVVFVYIAIFSASWVYKRFMP